MSLSCAGSTGVRQGHVATKQGGGVPTKTNVWDS